MAEQYIVDSTNFPQIQKTSSIIVNQTYSWITNTGFYASINGTYYSYYFHNVRRLAWWLDGYVPGFHLQQNGIFSTRIANSLVNSIGEAIFGRELLFKNVGREKKQELGNSSLEFMNKWSKKSNFQVEAKKATKYAQGLGTSLLKLNKSATDLWVEAVRLDYFYFEVTSRGKIKEVTCLLKGYTDIGKDNDKQNHNYYLVEKRFFKPMIQTTFKENGLGQMEPVQKEIEVPYVVYQIHKINNTVLNHQTWDTSMREDVRWDSLPKRIKEAIKNDYNVLKIGEQQELPFDQHLGVYLVTADEGHISLPQVPFGTSILENIVAYLMGYDIAYSYFFRDMYHGKSTIMMPKYMQQNKMKYGDQTIDSVFQGLDSSMFVTYETTSQEKQTIEQIQFNLRGQEWSQIRDYLIENIAMALQMSPRTIASFLTGSSIRTATQVNSEDSNSISFIETRRSVLEKPLNRLLADVSKYYKLDDEVEVRFSKEGVINMDQLVSRIGGLMQLGLIDLESALKEIMYDADEEQVKERYNKIMQEKQQQMMMQMQDMEDSQVV